MVSKEATKHRNLRCFDLILNKLYIPMNGPRLFQKGVRFHVIRISDAKKWLTSVKEKDIQKSLVLQNNLC